MECTITLPPAIPVFAVVDRKQVCKLSRYLRGDDYPRKEDTTTPLHGVTSVPGNSEQIRQKARSYFAEKVTAKPLCRALTFVPKKTTTPDLFASSHEATEKTTAPDLVTSRHEATKVTKVKTKSRIPEKQMDTTFLSDVTIKPLRESLDSSSDCEAIDKTNNKTLSFIVNLTVALLHKCNVGDLQKAKEQTYDTYIKPLVNKTLEGLTLRKDFSWDYYDVNQICKTLIKDLKREFGSIRKLNKKILSKEPSVEDAIAKSMQNHIMDYYAYNRDKNRPKWRQLIFNILPVVVIAVVLVGLVFVVGILL